MCAPAPPKMPFYCCYWAARQNASPSRGTNRPNGGLFHATAATNPICAGAGSGEERRDETNKKTFNTPAPTQHHRAKREAHHHQQRNPPPRLLSGRRWFGTFCVTIETRTSSRARVVPIGGRRPQSSPPCRRRTSRFIRQLQETVANLAFRTSVFGLRSDLHFGRRRSGGPRWFPLRWSTSATTFGAP